MEESIEGAYTQCSLHTGCEAGGWVNQLTTIPGSLKYKTAPSRRRAVAGATPAWEAIRCSLIGRTRVSETRGCSSTLHDVTKILQYRKTYKQMANMTSLQTAVTLCKSTLTQLNTALSDLASTSVSSGATADNSGTLDARVATLRANLLVMIKEVADIKASVVS